MPLDDDIRSMIEHDTTEAQVLLHRLADDMPDSVEVFLLLALSHLRRLEYEPALDAYRRVLALDPRHNEAMHSAALCLVALGDQAGALAAYNQAFTVTASAQSLRGAALLQHRMGQLEWSIRGYETVLSRSAVTSPEVSVVLQGLIAVLRDAGRPLAADRQAQRLLDRLQRERAQVASYLNMKNSADDFLEWSRYVDKARLGQTLTRRRATDPAGRIPETFVLPEERQALAAFAAGDAAPQLYIVKPIRGSGGQGISVTNDVNAALDRTEVVVQRYLDRPWLVNGRKSHCRIYGLITSADPLRAYVYTEGVVRFAPEPYDPRPDAPGGVAMHVTNTALHLDHPDMSISQDPSQEDTGMIWSLSAFLRRVTADGGDGQQVFAEIKALMEWFVRMLAADGLFARQAAAAPPRAYPHKLFGLDVLIDADGHPWLIEMQRIPASTGQPLVTKVNMALYVDMFHMAQAVLIDDAMSADEVAAIRQDPEALRRREAELEMTRRGKFAPLDL